MAKTPREEIARDTCYHEAAHSVFVHHHSDFGLRYVEVDLKGDGSRQDITGYSGHPLMPNLRQAKDLAVMCLAGEYAVWRGRFGHKRGGYEPFERFAEDADPERRLRDLGDYDDLGRLLQGYADYYRGEGGWREYREEYGGDGADALVNLCVVASHARMFAQQVPSPEEVPGGNDMLRWCDLRNCYEDASHEAFRFLDERWAEIDALAKRLMQMGHLDGSEVARLVEGVDEAKNDA